MNQNNLIRYGLQKLADKFNQNNFSKLINVLIIIRSQIKKYDINPELMKEFIDSCSKLDTINSPMALLMLWKQFKLNRIGRYYKL